MTSTDTSPRPVAGERTAVFVDLDGTLYRGVALFEALAFAFAASNRHAEFDDLMAQLDEARAEETREQLNRRVAAALTGWSATELARSCREWFDTARGDFDATVLAAVQRHVARGDHVVLVSASYDEVVAPFAAQLGIERTCSELVVRDGLLTGDVRRVVAGGEKADVARERCAAIGSPLARAVAYADDESDAELLVTVGTPVVVGPRADSVRARMRQLGAAAPRRPSTGATS